MNRIQRDGGVSENNVWIIIFLLSFLLTTTAIIWLFHGPARVVERYNAFIVRTNYRLHLVAGILSLPMQWHTDNHSGDTIDKVTKATARLESFSEETFQIIQSIIRLIGALAVLAYFSPIACLIVGLTILLNLNIIVRFDKVLVKHYYVLSRNENVVAEKIHDAITNIATVFYMRVKAPLMKSIERKILEPKKLALKNMILGETKWFLVSMFGNLMLFLTLATYVYHGRHGGVVMYGTLFALYGYISRINEVFSTCASMYSNLIKQQVSVSEAENIASNFSDETEDNSPIIPRDWKKLEIRSLNFSYHDNEKEENLHLDDIFMDIHRGEKIALIGDSGSGKTTFLKVLAKAYDVKNLDFYCDGRRFINGFSALRSDVSLIPQLPEVFKMTIEDNITFEAETDQVDLNGLTDLACLTPVVKVLPKGLRSSIKEDGCNLSGGEVQRLALARGLYASTSRSILLLDESTSSVDFSNEMNIYQNIWRVFSEKTIIASVHKLHLLPLFDKIYFFRNGSIIASGTLQELLVNSPEFFAVWEKCHNQEVLDEDEILVS